MLIVYNLTHDNPFMQPFHNNSCILHFLVMIFPIIQRRVLRLLETKWSIGSHLMSLGDFLSTVMTLESKLQEDVQYFLTFIVSKGTLQKKPYIISHNIILSHSATVNMYRQYFKVSTYFFKFLFWIKRGLVEEGTSFVSFSWIS